MPKLEKITIERKFSKCIRRDGLEEWHGVTHTAEATALRGETYEMAQETLDEQVRKGLVQAYSTMRRGSQATEVVQQTERGQRPVAPLVKAALEMGAEIQGEHVEEPPPAPPVDPAWCPIHKVKMKQWFAKDGSVRSWYSHNDDTTSGEWCQGEQE